jgi:hypothetical protein
MPSLVLQLEVLPKADLIITMVDGRIAEIGTYNALLKAEGAMAKLLAEHIAATPGAGAGDEGLLEEVQEIEMKKLHVEDELVSHAQEKDAEAVGHDSKLKGGLISAEERETGAVGGAIYAKYIRSMRGFWVSRDLSLLSFSSRPLTTGGPLQKAPTFLALLLLAQVRTLTVPPVLYPEQKLTQRRSIAGSQRRYDRLPRLLERQLDRRLGRIGLYGSCVGSTSPAAVILATS